MYEGVGDFFKYFLFQWMRQFWKSDPCYEKEHGVNGTICSFIVYLSEASGTFKWHSEYKLLNCLHDCSSQ